MKKHILLTIIGLIVVAIGCLYSLYWVLFSAWMTAYLQNDYDVWKNNLYIWLGVFIGLGIVNISGIYWTINRIRKSANLYKKIKNINHVQ